MFNIFLFLFEQYSAFTVKLCRKVVEIHRYIDLLLVSFKHYG